VQVGLLNDDIYVVKGRKHITSIFRNPSLTMTRAYGIVLKNCFGMQEEAVQVYTSDTSGSRSKPISGSQVAPSARIGHSTHEILTKSLLGQGLENSTKRFETAFYDSIDTLAIGDDWVSYPDLTAFMELTIGTPIVKSLFGSLLLQENMFIRDLFEYDKGVMHLATQLPFILAPKAHMAKWKMLRSIKRWHQRAGDYCAQNVGQEAKDFAWGGDMMKQRQETLSKIDKQDSTAIASADLALIWA
jgi:hypothetical protein